VLAAGALGDYELMDHALTTLEEQKREEVKAIGRQTDILRALSLADHWVVPTMYTHINVAASLVAPRRGLISDLNSALLNEQLTKAELYNTIALRGIMALEAGETKQARTIFESVLKESSDNPFFSDRPIAARYLELLEAQKR
jgi:hypothetical protein